MTVFEFVFIGMFLTLSWILFLIFGLSFAIRVMLTADIFLVILLIQAPIMLKIEAYPVAIIGTYLYVIAAIIAPAIIYNYLNRHAISIIAIIEISFITVLLTVSYKDFDKEIPKRVYTTVNEQHTTMENSDWI